MNTLIETAQHRLQKNLQVFKQEIPGFYDAYRNYTPRHFRVAAHPQGYLTVLNGKQDIYKHDPVQSTVIDLDRFYKHVGDESLNLIDSIRVKDTQNFKDMEIIKRNQASLIPEREEYPDNQDTTSLLIINGVMLGHHVIRLLRRYSPEHIIILEPNTDLFYTSLHAIEWKEFFDHLKDIDCKSYFIVGSDADTSLEKTKTYMNSNVPPGQRITTKVYSPHRGGEYEQIKKDITDLIIQGLKQGIGFFDDEIYHLKQTIYNMQQCPSILHRHPSEGISEPVFLVAAGPSLNENLNFIKENQHKAFVISAGSSLKPLLNAGIKPDYHVEVESSHVHESFYRDYYSDDDLASVDAIVSADTPHTITPRYRNNLLFFRSPGCAQQVLYNNENVIKLKKWNPFCTNSALRLIAHFKAQEVYLFGVDCGFKDPDNHHVKGSYSYEKKYDFTRTHKENYLSVPGVNDEPALSTSMMKLSADNIGDLLSDFPELTAYNCSKGARLKNTQEIEANSLCLEKTVDKEGIKEKVSKLFSNSIATPETYFSAMDILLLATNGFSLYWRALVEELPKTAQEYDKKVEMFSYFFDKRKIKSLLSSKVINAYDPVAAQLLMGPCFSIQVSAHQAFRKCQTEEQKLATFPAFKELVQELCDHIESEIETLVTDIKLLRDSVNSSEQT